MRTSKKIRPMEKLGDDMLALICSYITDPKDLKSLSLVCKLWLRIQRLQRLTLRVVDLNLLQSFLPRFPNLLKFQVATTISNAQLRFIVDTCPRIQVLHLLIEPKTFSHDFDDEGLYAISKGCRNLREIVLRWRIGIGYAWVASLAGFSRNLRSLDLAWCTEVYDEALESIGSMNILETLNLKACWYITDVGLAFLTKGSLCKTLKRLSLAHCDRITDFGMINYLKKLSSLEVLNLSHCGVMITDIGGVTALAEMRSLISLNLTWLNLSDATISALAMNCKKLEVLNLTSCRLISRIGVRAFSGHKSLKRLYLESLCELNGHDLEHIVLGCKNLEYIAIDDMLKHWVSMSAQNNILKRGCVLDWKPFIL